jgi:hypothetical protein
MDEDPSYSLLLWKEDTLDPMEDKLVRDILSRMCADGSPLVVDVGCNFGCAARAQRPPTHQAACRAVAVFPI